MDSIASSTVAWLVFFPSGSITITSQYATIIHDVGKADAVTMIVEGCRNADGLGIESDDLLAHVTLRHR